ncbi:recombinase family protein [Candidatus Peregrinibacteria bacterium]|nr:recombinase family protein [Candidatus Peregrinibacteria bacterium]
MSPLKFFVYCRATTPHVRHYLHSVEGQKRTLLNFAAEVGLNIWHVFTEVASASRSGARPIFLDMLRRLERGEANAVLTCDLCRLTRNYPDGTQLADMLYRGILKEIRTPTEIITSGFTLKLSLNLQQFERQQLSENIKRGLRARKIQRHEP